MENNLKANIGKDIYYAIRDGVHSCQRILSHKSMEGIVVLMPFYMKEFLLDYLLSLPYFPTYLASDVRNKQYSNRLLTLPNGIEVFKGHKPGCIMVYHESFPLKGIEPFEALIEGIQLTIPQDK